MAVGVATLILKFMIAHKPCLERGLYVIKDKLFLSGGQVSPLFASTFIYLIFPTHNHLQFAVGVKANRFNYYGSCTIVNYLKLPSGITSPE